MRWTRRKVAGHGYLVENVGIGQSGVDEGVGALFGKGATAGLLEGRAGNDGVCDSGRRARGHRNPGDYGVPPEIAGALGCDRRWHQRLVTTFSRRNGQSTVEFAIVAAALVAVTVALMAFWKLLANGQLVQHALAVASHHIQMVAPATISDLFLY